MLEIFLDAMLAYGATSNSYLLAEGYEATLDDADLEVRRALESLMDAVSDDGRNSRSWPVVERMLDDLGYGETAPRRSWSELPARLGRRLPHIEG